MTGADQNAVAAANVDILTELLVAAGMELARRGVQAERIDNQTEEGSNQRAVTCYLLVDGIAVYMATVTADINGKMLDRSQQGCWLVTGLRQVALTDLAEAVVELDRVRRKAS